jgi:thiosulfate/3-mercaptopyruvate sulfurtransferase
MRTLTRSLALVCCAAGVAGAQRASNARDALLVTPQWLASHLKDPNLVILHVGDPAKYAAKHIPGARLIDLDDIALVDTTEQFAQMRARNIPIPTRLPPLIGSTNGLALEMPSAEQLRSQLQKFGISDDSRIVIYQADQWFSPSTRVLFTLDYVGLGNRTVVLDGGLAAWAAANNEVTDAVPAPAKPGSLSPIKLRPIIANAQFVHERAGNPGVALIDARAASFYDGVPPSNGADSKNRLGHIPRAKSLPFNQMFDDKGFLKPADQLRAMFDAAGVQPSDTVVAYCHVGQQATAVLFAARALGHPVLLYDGSFNEWNKLTQYPVELPAAKGKP